MIDIAATFITFFSVVDPIGTVPVFIAVTSRFDDKARRRIAFAAVAAAGILLFFVVVGELILTAMSIILTTVLMITYVLMLTSGPIHRLIGNSGARVVSRVMGLILASVAMSNLLAGVKSYFGLE